VNKKQAIIYNNGEIELNVSIDNETIWLRQDEISKLFEIYTYKTSGRIGQIFSSNSGKYLSISSHSLRGCEITFTTISNSFSSPPSFLKSSFLQELK